MKRRLSVFVLLLPLLIGGLAFDRSSEYCIAITDVTVIDATGAPPKPDMTVLITGGRIREIGEDLDLPEGALVVDGCGKFLIPGLWDMHVHILQRNRVNSAFSMLLANGIVGVRDMGSPPSSDDDYFGDIRTWRIQTATGIVPGPYIVAAGPLVDGNPPMFPGLSVSVTDRSEGRRLVDVLTRQGADFIKVYTLLSRDAYFGIAMEANRLRIPFAGHVPESVNAVEASDAGQRSIEHLTGIWLACSSIEDALRAELLNARMNDDPAGLYAALSGVQTKAVQTYSEEKANALFARFAANGTWQVPTLVVSLAVELTSNYKSNSPQGPSLTTPAFNLDVGQFGSRGLGANLNSLSKLISGMRRAGVEFMAGTDAPNPWVPPGDSLHEELALLVACGFTPMEALQAATRNPAKYLGLADSIGTIEPGKLADLVLLERNPLEDITNSRTVNSVIVRGRLISKAQLIESLERDAVVPSGPSLRATVCGSEVAGERRAPTRPR
jgi:hypothetical protein